MVICLNFVINFARITTVLICIKACIHQLKIYLAKDLPYLWVEVTRNPVECSIQPAPPQPLAMPVICLLSLPLTPRWCQKTANGTLLLPQIQEQDTASYRMHQ